MGRRPLPMTLTRCMEALDAAEICLRTIGSDWVNVPIAVRVDALRCANVALGVLMAAGHR